MFFLKAILVVTLAKKMLFMNYVGENTRKIQIGFSTVLDKYKSLCF